MENITAGNEAQGIEDMIHLDTMSEETILKNLGVRYGRDQIYTYTGAILVSVNPYQALPIYTADVAKRYNNKPLGDVEPHIFAIADVAYQTMMEDGGNRSVIISGESGAGKTEATKLLLQYLALKTSGVNKAHSAPEAATKKKSLIEQLILESSPILEAFGNAKTVRNDNSSRFGKYMKIDFDPRGSIAGAKIENYLLEKSRIVYQAQDERNYHIFYQFCAGLSPEEKVKYKVGAATDFHYINQSGCHTIPHVDDANDFSEVRNALSVLGIGPEEDIWAVVAAVLHMGNIRFAPQGDGSVVVNTDSLQHVASNLGVAAEKLAESMTVRYNKIRNEVFRVPLKPEEAADVRDAIAKALYGRQFNWLVERINRSISKSASTNARSFIGVLDIFGFENFTVNSFEQLCINYANEKLQQQFNQHIFKQEQEEYEREKISWETISFNDNQGCIDLIEKPLGILSLLDEECFFPKACLSLSHGAHLWHRRSTSNGSDGTFLEKLNKAHEKHTYFEKPKTRGDKFVIRHYAGDVAYSTKSFLDKNRDTIPESASALLAGASIAHVAQLFPEGQPAAQAQAAQGGRGGKGRSPTVGAQFKNQLLDLVATLSATYPYYVRCLKPNPQKKPSLFDNDLVLAQLRYCGMLETIRIRKLGFPIRREFVAFRDRYRLLAPSSAWEKDDRKACSMILDAASYRMTPGHYTLGLSKVFMRDEQSTILEQLRNEHLLASVLLIQKTWRCYSARSHFTALRKGAITAQTHYRKRVARVEYTRLRDASITIQTWTRMVFARRRFLAIRKGVLAVQAATRTMLAIKEKQRLIREEQERQRRLEEIRKLKDKEERERREREEQERQDQERKQKVEKERQEKERQERERQEKERLEKKEMERLREEAQRRDQAALGLPASETLADYQAMQRGNTAQNFAVEEVPPEAQQNLDSESLEEAWLHALDPLNVPQVEWDLPPAPEGLPPPPPAQAGVLDFLSTPLYGYQFKDFATRHFRPHKTDTIQQLITASKKPLSAPLLQLTLEDAKNAVEVSRKIHIYMTHKKTLAENLSVVQYILQRGLSSPDLRDEIFCQLLKQVTGNPTPEHEEHCWELIMFCCCTFAPTEFLKYFVCSLDEASTRSSYASHASFAKESLTRLMTTSDRKLVPSLMELEAIRKREPMMLRVFFLDGSVKALLLDSAATVAELKQQIVTKLQMKFAKGFALYKSYSQIERLMEDEEKMGDELSSFEQLRNAMGEQQLRMRILFKKRLYFTDDVPDIKTLDKASLDLLFAQASEDIRTGRLPTTREVVLELAGLKLHSDSGDYNGEPVDDKQIGVYIPAYIRYKFQQEDWAKLMAGVHQAHKGRSERDVRIDYLKTVFELPLYGAALFAMELQNNIINLVRDQGYLAVSGRGVCFVTRDQKGEVVMTSYMPYEDILNWECTPTTTSLTLSLGTRREVLDLKCEQSAEVERLLRDYTSILAAASEWARAISDYETEDPSLLSFRQGDVIHVKEKDDYSGWYKGLNFTNNKEGAFPRDLVKMLVAKPKTTETGRKKPPTTSTYLTTRKTNRLSMARGGGGDSGESAAAGADDGQPAAGAPVETSKFRTQMEVKGASIFRPKKLEQVSVSQLLSFSAQPIKASLVQLLPEASKQAVEMFQLVMKYMGDYPTRLSQAKYDALPAKTIQMAIDNRELRDELYCQLMKQTNKNPRDTSNEKGWELLALCTGCFLPQDEMLDRLYKRLEEHETDAKVGYYAKQAVDRLQNTILVGERELAPSHAEITALRNRTRIMCRVALPNGSHRAVLVDAWTTVGDVVPEVIRQLRFQNQPKSFGLFEITPQVKNEIRLKVPLADDMFVCDALARWEKAQKKDKNNRIPDAPLEMRKKLFFPIEQDEDLALTEDDDMLADFLFSQVCEDFLSGQLPAPHKEVAKLGACLLHVRFRASDAAASINSGVLSEIVGKSLANKKEAQQITSDIEEAYGEFAGLPIITAKRSFLGVASKLPLYGAALFPARQNEHPQSVWFAVSSKGVSIVEADHPHAVYKFWSYREVANWGNTKQNFHLVAGNLQKPEKKSFTSAYSAHISAMYACFTSRPGDAYVP